MEIFIGVLRIVGFWALVAILVTSWILAIIFAVRFYRENSGRLYAPWEKADKKGLTIQAQVQASLQGKKR